MTEDKRYEVNFFKPLSGHGRANRKLILILASIWAVAVFGFQFTLMILNEPTPEESYTVFESVYPEVLDNANSDMTMKQNFSKSLISVLGKNIAVSDQHKVVLKNVLSWTVFSMQNDSMKFLFQQELNDEAYQQAASLIGLKNEGFEKIMIDLLPYSLVKVEAAELSEEYKNELPSIMKLYLVHNQNALTNFKFLGFPFHYWYTAQFLLIMFVILCLVYALVIEKTNLKHNFVEET